MPKPGTGAVIDLGAAIYANLVACWLINEGSGNTIKNYVDASTNALNGTTWTTFGGELALDFDGNDDWFAIADLVPGSVATLELWVAFDSLVDQRLWSNTGTLGNAPNFALRVTAASEFQAFPDAGTIDWTTLKTDAVNIVTGNLVQLVCAVTSAATATGYVNASAGAGLTVQSYAIGAMRFGDKFNNLFGNWFDGQLVLARIWTRVLSGAEVTSLFNDPYQSISEPGGGTVIKVNTAGQMQLLTGGMNG
jgi:hypothetical protein